MDYVIGWVRVKPGLRDVFLHLAQPFVDATRSEAGVVFFEFLLSYEDPDVLVAIECYATSRAHLAHVDAAHYPVFWNLLESMVAESRFENVKAAGSFTEVLRPGLVSSAEVKRRIAGIA